MRRLVLAVILVLAVVQPGKAQEPTTAGFLFSYEPHPGEGTLFRDGYRRHLEWHREKGDSLNWFGWEVLVGPRPGAFVDGVFGVPFAALDARVDPAGDRADAEVNVLPYAEPTDREVVALRPDLGTAAPLEAAAPSPLVQVVRYTVAPGSAELVGKALEELARRTRDKSLLPYTIYERVAGSAPGFIMMVWRDRLATFDEHGRNPERALRRVLAERASGAGHRGAAVERAMSEVWVYRPGMTYVGSGGEAR